MRLVLTCFSDSYIGGFRQRVYKDITVKQFLEEYTHTEIIQKLNFPEFDVHSADRFYTNHDSFIQDIDNANTTNITIFGYYPGEKTKIRIELLLQELEDCE